MHRSGIYFIGALFARFLHRGTFHHLYYITARAKRELYAFRRIIPFLGAKLQIRTNPHAWKMRKEVKQVILLPGFAQSEWSGNSESCSHRTTARPRILLSRATPCLHLCQVLRLCLSEDLVISEKMRRRELLEELNFDGRITLNRMLKKGGISFWSGFIWTRIGPLNKAMKPRVAWNVLSSRTTTSFWRTLFHRLN
jgi:hypothetical protein